MHTGFHACAGRQLHTYNLTRLLVNFRGQEPGLERKQQPHNNLSNNNTNDDNNNNDSNNNNVNNSNYNNINDNNNSRTTTATERRAIATAIAPSQ